MRANRGRPSSRRSTHRQRPRVEPGEAVREGGVLLTVVDSGRWNCGAGGVDEAMRVKPGATVLYTLDAARGDVRGRVTRVDPRADPATRRVGVASTLSNPNQRIVAGQFARGRVLTGGRRRRSWCRSPRVGQLRTASVFVIQNAGWRSARWSWRARRRAGAGRGSIRTERRERVLAVPVLGAAED